MAYFKKIIVFDVETGGLDVKNPSPITELCMVAIDFESLRIVDKFSVLISPYQDYSRYTREAEETTGITIDMLINDGLDVDVVGELVMDFADIHTENGVKPALAGHNIKSFDMHFLNYFFESKKRSISRYFNVADPFDTLTMSRAAFPNSSVHTLSAACANVGVSLEGAHRAEADTVANAELLIELLKRLRGENLSSKSGGIEKKDVNFKFKTCFVK